MSRGWSLIDLTGRSFGLLTVIRRNGSSRRSKAAMWLCRCACGEEVTVKSEVLTSGLRVRCHYRRHLPNRSPNRRLTYRSWEHMIRRCVSPSSERFGYYGGRGIMVCERWLSSFDYFLADMGERPGPGYSIDRIDVNGDYEPGNCRWATDREQRLNQRRTIWVVYQGERVRLVELCERLGVDRSLVASRLKLGWPVGRAVSLPSRRYS